MTGSRQIQAKELMIGNYGQLWHFWGKDWTDVIQLTGEHIYWLSENKTSFKPVPLTEEWLVKLGCEMWAPGCYKIGFLLIYPEHKIITINKDNETIELKYTEYVHTFQNFVFALTGEELTIK